MPEEPTTEDRQEPQRERRRPGVPKFYYWAKSPPKPAPYRTTALNHEQRRFRVVVGAFTIAKALAVIAFILLLFARI
ncbi:MAG: hypothetical protein ABSF83_05955 [Nitrososphaerales archaeon]|jgi:hypothetical protein